MASSVLGSCLWRNYGLEDSEEITNRSRRRRKYCRGDSKKQPKYRFDSSRCVALRYQVLMMNITVSPHEEGERSDGKNPDVMLDDGGGG